MRKYIRALLIVLITALIASCALLAAPPCAADTIRTKDDRELKGIVVEDYRDRLVFSTPDGEVIVMKSDIKELAFDSEEDNLIKLAEQAKDRGDYVTSYGYYDMAFKLNPDSRSAKDGLVFLQGYLFRKGQADKEEAVRMRDEFERYGEAVRTEKSDEAALREAEDQLKRSLGITLKMKGAFPEIETIDARSPSYEAGARRGDLLVAVWGRLTGYMPLKDVMDLLLKKPALEIKCTIERVLDVGISADRTLLTSSGDLIGAVFSMEFDGLTVAEVREGGPSFAAGLGEGDLVTALDGKPTRYMPLQKAVEFIRESKGTKVSVTVRRETILWRIERTR